jgi:hypothetical protein
VQVYPWGKAIIVRKRQYTANDVEFSIPRPQLCINGLTTLSATFERLSGYLFTEKVAVGGQSWMLVKFDPEVLVA